MLQVKTSSGKWEKFCNQILDFLKQDIVTLNIEGQTVRGFRSPDSPALWIRDHSDMLRAGKYFEPDVFSTVECFANTQAANGRIFDYVVTAPLKDSTERENWEKWVRVPVEADVEYRFVKAAFLAWQATGDTAWLKNILPNLECAMNYTLSSPLRWDQYHKLVKRPYTIDTWDFDYTAGRTKWLNFQITDDTYWGIFYGDNSGVFEASLLLAQMCNAADFENKAKHWRMTANGIRERANNLLFNGRFYTHFYKLTPMTIEACKEAEQLSLSTPMAINRGMATHKIAAAILSEYQMRRETTEAFAEWFGIDPPFPDGIFGDEKLIGGSYINGGIFPLVGGELAHAAFEHGFEEYGLRTLEQYREMISVSGETYLWYFPNGTPSTVAASTSPEALPTDGWGSSAMLYAFIEGLCGIEDLSHSFQKVQFAPRWAVTTEDEIEVDLSYAASKISFGYEFRHLKGDCTIRLKLATKISNVELHVLMPKNCRPNSVLLNGNKTDFTQSKIENSNYVDLNSVVKGTAEIEINYRNVL